MSLAPIILFVYNRPDHTSRALESLMQNELANQSDLFIYADGAKADATIEQINSIKKVGEVIRSKKWCNSITIFESESNKGLADSIIHGVTETLNKYEKVIVLEDDLVTSKYFLKYMNYALNVYEKDENVACISAYVYPVKNTLPETFFIKGADCWGWATWKRAWTIFEPDGKKLFNELAQHNLTAAFDFDNTYPYIQMLSDQINGLNNSWAIRWYASAFLQNKFCLYPGKSLVQNIGFDGSGIHSNISELWNVLLNEQMLAIKKMDVVQDSFALEEFKTYFRSLQPSLRTRLKIFLKENVKWFLKK